MLINRLNIHHEGFKRFRLFYIARSRHIRTAATQFIPTAAQTVEDDIFRIRNVGIIAHIDAGKTTTTERMLYYAGQTRRIGNVDDGSTVTDFLPAERARGVTIQSAAISFTWPVQPSADGAERSKFTALEPHAIQLIDTPGHADFTFEVQRSLRVLDGAVCILDAVAGVEAQTEKVWFQASKYGISKIIYVNKLDREGASFHRTVQHVATRLHVWPAVCHIPWWNHKGELIGLGDVVNLSAIRWPHAGDGRDFEVIDADKLAIVDAALADEIYKARRALVETLTEQDVGILDTFLEAESDGRQLSAAELSASLRRCVLDPDINVVPVFAGASFQNIGVQALLDAIVQYLPSPNDGTNVECDLVKLLSKTKSTSDGKSQTPNVSTAELEERRDQDRALTSVQACALAFKVVYDLHKGLLVYVRVYAGVLRPQTTVFNSNMQQHEKVAQLMKMYADASTQVSSISSGQIGVIPGLKITRTGDTLVNYAGSGSKQPHPATSRLLLQTIETPPPVFFASIEPHTSADEKNVKHLLDILVREDPSLEITKDEETGQIRLNGMGEFHLEIAHDRLINQLKAKANMGNIEISYRETILESSPSDLHAFDREQGGKQARASCLVQVEPLSRSHHSSVDDHLDSTSLEDGNRVTIRLRDSVDSESRFTGKLPSHLPKEVLYSSLMNGILSALSRGINYPYPVSDAHVILTLVPPDHLFGTDTTPAALTSLATQAIRTALKTTALKHGSALMELYMNVIISCDEVSLGAVVKDISSARAGQILSLDDGANTSGSAVNDNDHLPPSIDANEVYTPPDPFGGSVTDSGERAGGQRSVVARVPLKEMVGYLKHLRSLTEGRGSFTMTADRFERVVGMREKEILKEIMG